jgi:hypothetical protein
MPIHCRSRLLASAAMTAALTALLLGTGGLSASGAPASSTAPATAAASTATTEPTTTEPTTTEPTTTEPTTTEPTTTEPTTTEPTTTEPTTTEPTTTAPEPAPGPACSTDADAVTPVICLPTGSGEDQPTPIGTDGFVEFAGQVVNNGLAVSDATVVISLPEGLRLESDEDDPINRYDDWWSTDSNEDGTPLECTSSTDGSVVTCDTGSVPAGANFLVVIDLVAQDSAVVGTSETFTVTLESTPTSGAFPTTSVQATVDFVGTAHLQVVLTPTKATVVVGQSLTFVATVHNVGPNEAVEAAGIGLVFPVDFGDDQPFLITNSEPLPGTDSASAKASGATFALRRLPARTAATRTAAPKIADPTTPSDIGYWPIGTIAVGQTVKVQVVVKAESVGQAELDFDAGSADESCDDGTDPDCENIATADLDAIAPTTAPTTTPTTAPTTTTPPTSASATSSAAAATTTAAAALPNTGFRTASWTWTGFAAVAFGLGLVLVARPRRHRPGHR